MNFIAINYIPMFLLLLARSNRNKHLVKLEKLLLLEIKTINNNKRQTSYQEIGASGFGFGSYKRSKGTNNKVFIKSLKIPVSNFFVNQAKEQGTNIKAQKLVTLVLKSETSLEGKKNIMTNVFPHRYNLYKNRKKTMLLINNPVFREYNQI